MAFSSVLHLHNRACESAACRGGRRVTGTLTMTRRRRRRVGRGSVVQRFLDGGHEGATAEVIAAMVWTAQGQVAAMRSHRRRPL